MKRIKQSFFSLPNDILIDILAKLPLRSLVRFLCVAKSMQSLITHPSFKLNNSDFTSYFILQYHSRKRTDRPGIVICINQLLLKPQISDDYANGNAKYDVDHHIMKLRRIKGYYQVSGSSNGLLLYASWSSSYSKDLTDDTKPMYLWNPGINRYKKVPQLPEYACSTFASKQLSCRYNNIRQNGFGYCGTNGFNDYKLVSIYFHNSCNYSMRCTSRTYCRGHVSVYSLVTDSWKSLPSANVPSDLAKYGDDCWDELSLYFRLFSYAFVGGVYYWLVPVPHNKEDSYSIVGFDLVNERFLDNVIRPPNLSRPPRATDKVYLFELNGRLALYEATYKLRRGRLWELTNNSSNCIGDEKETWMQLSTIKVDNIKELLMDKRLPYALRIRLEYDNIRRLSTGHRSGRCTTAHGTYVKSLALLGIEDGINGLPKGMCVEDEH